MSCISQSPGFIPHVLFVDCLEGLLSHSFWKYSNPQLSVVQHKHKMRSEVTSLAALLYQLVGYVIEKSPANDVTPKSITPTVTTL